MAVVFLHVGVAVLSRREHEGDIFIEPAFGVVVAVAAHQFGERQRQLEIERVLPRLQKLVVVDAALAPILRLLAQDVPLVVERRVARPPENAVGVGGFGGGIAGDRAVVAIERVAVVIPVHRHRHGIGNERPPQGVETDVALGG